MKTQQAIYSFSSGVCSPRISARADSDKFVSALRTGQNFIITPQGGAVFREGFKHLEVTVENRIFQFHQGGNESDIVIEILPATAYQNGTIHFHGDSSISITSLTNVHSYLLSELDDLYFTNQERFGIITHINHPPLYLEFLLDGTFTAADLPAEKIPNHVYDDEKSPGAATGIDSTYSCTWANGASDSWQGGNPFSMRYNGVIPNDGAPEPAFLFVPYSTTSSVMVANIQQLLDALPELTEAGTGATASVIGTPDATKTYLITIVGNNAGALMTMFPENQASVDRTIQIIQEGTTDAVNEKAWSFPTYVLHSGNYWQCNAPHKSESGVIEPGVAPGDETYWTDLGATKPDSYDYQYPVGNAWVEDVVYAPGDRGFPSVCVFHQQRLILSAPPDASTALFGSRIGIYDDFIKGVDGADPFSFTLDTSDTPTIKWMTSQLDLIVGTSGGEWRIGAEVTIGPTDIAAFKQNNTRAFKSVPAVINTEIFYIEQGNTKIRATQYSRQLQGFSSTDVSLIAEHLLHAGVKRLILMQTPEVLIVALKNDGTLIALTYGDEIGAWVEWISQSQVHDICAYYSTVTNQDELFATNRYGDNYYLEHMPYPSRVYVPRETQSDESLIEQGVVCLDSWIEGTVVNNLITGLEHLEGQVVAALVDDAWTGTYTVTGGQITLSDTNISGSEPYNGVSAVGLLYTGVLDTFEIASGNRKGTGLGTRRRWSRLFVRLLDSSLPIINGQLPPDRTPEMQMDIAEIIREGLTNPEIRSVGWGDGSINITQNRPYPTHIVGVFGEFNSENA